MDIESIMGAYSALKAAKDIAGAAMELRDFNQLAAAVSKINAELIKAQDGLLAQQAMAFDLQTRYHQAMNELRELKEAATERSRYGLFELSKDVFVYRAKISGNSGSAGTDDDSEPLHHLCQPCFDKGTKVVLKRHSHYGAIYLKCGVCSGDYFTGVKEPWNPPRLNF